jgi:hypothetical protein
MAEGISVDLLSGFSPHVSRHFGPLIEDRILFEARRRSA